MRSTEPEVRTALAANPRSSTELHPRLAHDVAPAVRTALLRQPRLDPAAARVLAIDPLEDVRSALARRADLAAPTQELLASDPSEDVLLTLLRRRDLTPSAVALMPVALLSRAPGGRALLSSALEGLDAAAAATLSPGWAGTVGELVTTLEAFAPE